MSALSLSLDAFAALAAAALATLFARIARFYEQSSGIRSRSRWFGLPAGFFLLAGVFSALMLVGWSAVFWLAGGGSLVALAVSLYRQMTGSSR